MDLPDAIDYVRGCIVQITYTITGLPHRRLRDLNARGAVWSMPMGTGFVIDNNGWVVTAKHVIDAVGLMPTEVPEGNHFVGVGFAHDSARPGTFRVIKYDVVAEDRRNDIALLKLRINPFRMSESERRSDAGDPLHLAVAQLRTARPRDGTAIAVSGYPLNESALVTTAGSIASAWSVDIEGTLLPDGHGGYAPTDVADRFLADVQANPGNSGGPAYELCDGAVVGMLVATRVTQVDGLPGIHTNADLGVLIPMELIADFAVKHGAALDAVS